MRKSDDIDEGRVLVVVYFDKDQLYEGRSILTRTNLRREGEFWQRSLLRNEPLRKSQYGVTESRSTVSRIVPCLFRAGLMFA